MGIFHVIEGNILMEKCSVYKTQIQKPKSLYNLECINPGKKRTVPTCEGRKKERSGSPPDESKKKKKCNGKCTIL